MAVTKKPRGRGAAKASSRRKISGEEMLREMPGTKLVRFKAGTYIFREGTRSPSCFLITKGRVRILKRRSRGDEIPLAFVKPGEFLGELAMLSGEKRSASGLALTDVEAVLIGHDEFVNLLKARHLFASRLMFQLSTLLATRCQNLLRFIARQPDVLPLANKIPNVDVRAVLNRVYTLWAV
jgi:CRP-like cAMP-binding protein